jgi:nucleotide-binding universal stress UspA family protein
MEIDDRVKKAVADHRREESSKSEKILEETAGYFREYKSLRTITKFGDPSSEILSTAEQINADIIAVGSRGLKGVKGVLGSVSRDILIHSNSSVLIGKFA